MRVLTGVMIFLASCVLHAGDNSPMDSTPVAKSGDQPSPSALKPYRVEYSAKYNGIPITTVRTFNVIDGRYKVVTQARNLLGSIREEETFLEDKTGRILPLRYDYKRSIFGNNRSEVSAFDHDKQLITNTYKKETVTLKNPGEVLGPLSYQIQMQLDLVAGQRQFSYPVVTRGRIKNYRYGIARSEKLETPLGIIDTLVLERLRDDDERETFLWLAEKYQFLPVKLLQREDGESYEMLINSYTLINE